MFSHGFMSFAAVGITVACLLVMGTFSLVAYNVNEQLRQIWKVKTRSLLLWTIRSRRHRRRSLQSAVEAVPNVRSVRFITREEACETFEKKYEGKYALGDLDPEILRDRFAIKVIDLGRMEETREAVKKVTGIADARADENLAEGFITLRNVAGVVCIALIAILLVVSVFIISNTIKLTTFDRRDEIAIMKMVGATNGFIRWPFVYEGFIIGLLSAGVAFGLQWLLYATVARSISVSDALNLFSVVDFATIWKPVALVFVGVGMLVGVGGSLTAIRKFLQV